MECPICLEAFTEDYAVCPPCGHLFHRQCIDKHVAEDSRTKGRVTSARCPTCRQSFRPAADCPVFLPAQYRSHWQPGLRKVFLTGTVAAVHALDDLRARLEIAQQQCEEAQKEASAHKALYEQQQQHNHDLTGQLQAASAQGGAAQWRTERYKGALESTKARLHAECTAHQATRKALEQAQGQLVLMEEEGRVSAARTVALFEQWRERRLGTFPQADTQAQGQFILLEDQERGRHGMMKAHLERAVRLSEGKGKLVAVKNERLAERKRQLAETEGGMQALLERMSLLELEQKDPKTVEEDEDFMEKADKIQALLMRTSVLEKDLRTAYHSAKEDGDDFAAPTTGSAASKPSAPEATKEIPRKRVLVADNPLPSAPVVASVPRCTEAQAHQWKTKGSNHHVRKYSCTRCGAFVQEGKSQGYWVERD